MPDWERMRWPDPHDASLNGFFSCLHLRLRKDPCRCRMLVVIDWKIEYGRVGKQCFHG